MERTVKVGEVYRHFKGNTYEVLALAVNADNRERVVVYRSLANDKVFVRSFRGFTGEINKDKYPEATQTYRFELVEDLETEGTETEDLESEEVAAAPKAEAEVKTEPKKAPPVGEVTSYEYKAAAEGDVEPMLMEFLETRSFEEKLQILRRMEPIMTDKLLDDMAASLDVVIHDGDISDRIRELKTCLTTFDKFDCSDRFERK
ncbi:MAG: DUF1653 domain-containing protein [Lachnospiraceae bacterium]|nr:DUF1653 domain-containing protein [Lachnospiraceae bacterium]